MIRIRRPLMFAATALAALGLFASAQAADLPVGALVAGDKAAEFECKEAVNAEGPVDLKSLRGRVVLLELFSTG